MSSLRQDTLRLCWLEAFKAVVEKENISEAARELSIDQSTVTRYMQELQRWTGKGLIEPGKIHDPDDPRISIGITEAGHQFYKVAEEIFLALDGFRTEEAIRTEAMTDMKVMLGKMQARLRQSKKTDPIHAAMRHIKEQQGYLDSLPDSAPLDLVLGMRRLMRRFFANMERASRQRRQK